MACMDGSERPPPRPLQWGPHEAGLPPPHHHHCHTPRAVAGSEGRGSRSASNAREYPSHVTLRICLEVAPVSVVPSSTDDLQRSYAPAG
jgi:hypothetical protein